MRRDRRQRGRPTGPLSIRPEHWVTALAAIPADICQLCPSGGFATGCLDKRIRLYSHTNELLRVLEGHEGGVISLALDVANGTLVSGSWCAHIAGSSDIRSSGG